MTIESYWQEFVQKHPEAAGAKYEAWAFGNDPQMADELLQLVLAGKKTATTSAKELYALDGEAYPEVGGYSVLLDGQDNPRAVIVTTKLEETTFKEVTAEFAATEGEGDGSLAYWRAGHIKFFTREYEKCGLVFHEDIPVLCETFKVVY